MLFARLHVISLHSSAVVHEMAQLLDCGLDRKTVQILMALVDAGVNPSALAAAVKELRRQAEALGLGNAVSK